MHNLGCYSPLLLDQLPIQILFVYPSFNSLLEPILVDKSNRSNSVSTCRWPTAHFEVTVQLEAEIVEDHISTPTHSPAVALFSFARRGPPPPS